MCVSRVQLLSCHMTSPGVSRLSAASLSHDQLLLRDAELLTHLVIRLATAQPHVCQVIPTQRMETGESTHVLHYAMDIAGGRLLLHKHKYIHAADFRYHTAVAGAGTVPVPNPTVVVVPVPAMKASPSPSPLDKLLVKKPLNTFTPAATEEATPAPSVPTLKELLLKVSMNPLGPQSSPHSAEHMFQRVQCAKRFAPQN